MHQGDHFRRQDERVHFHQVNRAAKQAQSQSTPKHS